MLYRDLCLSNKINFCFFRSLSMEKPLKVLCYTISGFLCFIVLLIVLSFFGYVQRQKQVQHDIDKLQTEYDSIQAIKH